MRRPNPARTAGPAACAAALLLALAAGPGCKRKEEPSRAAAAALAPRGFDARDLAAAAALDARLAALTLEGSRALDLLTRREKAEAARLAPRIEEALQAAVAAGGAIAHPLDRTAADAALAAARRFAAALGDFQRAFAADERAPATALFQAREELGRAVNAYRQSRAGWRLEGPLAVGAAQELALARADLERAEMAAMEVSPAAPRDEGHRLEAGATRLGAQAAAGRAREAAGRLPPTERDAAARWVDAQERSLQALSALTAAPAAEQPRRSLAYQEARAEALAALAELLALQAGSAGR